MAGDTPNARVRRRAAVAATTTKARGRVRIPDLHPDDAAARLCIGREALGMSREALGGRLDRHKGGIQKLEGRDYWTVRTVQWWARGLERRFRWQLHGIPPLPTDAAAAMYADMRPATANAADELAVAVLITDLARARVACQLTQAQMAARLGITEGSVTRAERVEPNMDVAAAQRHLRCLGGWLELSLAPAPALEAVPA